MKNMYTKACRYLYLIIAVFLINNAKAQPFLASKYVDDRMHRLNYLHFKPEGTFEYSYLVHASRDIASGKYTVKKDSVFLKYDADTSDEHIYWNDKLYTAHRPDTLIIVDKLLYRVKNKVSREKTLVTRDTLHHKPDKSYHYKRKYMFWGIYQSKRYTTYFMKDERYVKSSNK